MAGWKWRRQHAAVALLLTVALGLAGQATSAAAQSAPTPGAAQSASTPAAAPTFQPVPTLAPLPTTAPVPTPDLSDLGPAPAAQPAPAPLPPAPIPSVATVAPQNSPAPSASPAAPAVALLAGLQPVGVQGIAAIPPSGGQGTFADGALNVYAFPDPSRPPVTLVYQGVDARTLPAAQPGLSLGFSAFQLSAVNDEPALVTSFNVPMDLVITPNDSDLALAVGSITRLFVATWNGSAWVALPCAPDATTATHLVCSITQPGVFVPLITLPMNPALAQLDTDITNGHFYTQGNGFGGSGGLGFSVVDDDGAPMWSEFQRQGGVNRLGYPISNRFIYGGAITQAFQRGALQWEPEIGQSVPLNILDELHAHGSDVWLEASQQIPPAPPDGQPADPSILSPFPALQAAYEADPDLYGLPVSVKDYGQIASARFQRSTLQVWQQEQSFAPVGTVIPGSPGDLALAAGLWPVSATTPGGPPPS